MAARFYLPSGPRLKRTPKPFDLLFEVRGEPWANIAIWEDGTRVTRDVGRSGEHYDRLGELKLVQEYRRKESLLFLYRDGRIKAFSPRSAWDFFSPLQKQRLRWLLPAIGAELPEEQSGQQAMPGRLSVPEEQFEVFRLLGERTPYLWTCAQFLEWARELSAAGGQP